MGRSLLRQEQFRGDTVTGYSLAPEVGFYDETKAYMAGNQVVWNRYVWECVNAVAAGTLDDLSNAPDVSADWERAPFTPAIVTTAANYNAAETWLFDILEVDTSGGNRTATLPAPATVAGWPEGVRLSIVNTGTNTLLIDPNGNTLTGSTATRSIIGNNDWVEIAKVDGELIILRSDVNHTHMKARSWMGF
jgi:hypothetical protein